MPILHTRPALIAVSFYCAHFQGLQGIFKRYENRSNVMFNIRRYAPKYGTNKLVEHNCDLKGPNKVWIFICLLN